MKHHDLPDPDAGDLAVAPHEGSQVPVADGTAGETRELQVHEFGRIRDLDWLTRNGGELPRRDHAPGSDTALTTSARHRGVCAHDKPPCAGQPLSLAGVAHRR